MVEQSPESTRAKFFERSQGGARRWQARDHIAPRQLSGILGVYSGGPEGRWQNEEGHTIAHYEQFMDLIQRMLTFDPLQRLKPSDGLDHPFLAPLARNRATAAATASPAQAPPMDSHQSQGSRGNLHAGGQGLSRVRTSSGGGLDAGGGVGGGGLAHRQPSQSHAHPDSTYSNTVTPPSTASADPHQPDPSMISTPPQNHSAATKHHPEQQGQDREAGAHARRDDPTVHISQQHQAELSTALHAVGCPESRLLHYHTLDWDAISEVLRMYTTIDHVALMQVRAMFNAFVGEKLRARRDKALQELLQMLRIHHPHTHSLSGQERDVARAASGAHTHTHSSAGSSIDELESVGSGVGVDPMLVDNSSSPAP
mmetsp:Transcript_11127/g.29812  ORF Transcript_11127/g.29812 Transcript_11127/m.29812 type:complete len:369 (+) Transcript_11127:538-1644(+)